MSEDANEFARLERGRERVCDQRPICTTRCRPHSEIERNRIALAMHDGVRGIVSVQKDLSVALVNNNVRTSNPRHCFFGVAGVPPADRSGARRL